MAFLEGDYCTPGERSSSVPYPGVVTECSRLLDLTADDVHFDSTRRRGGDTGLTALGTGLGYRGLQQVAMVSSTALVTG